VRLFEGCDGYADGEQLRDFIYIDDVVKVNLWFLTHPAAPSGIYNLGTGKARSFNAIAKTLIKLHGSGQLEYIPFPEHLKGCYQSFTEADISSLRKAGYTSEFTALEEGLKHYYHWMMTELPAPPSGN
jgi:ADP-L-glycero-D-manno-heptose 6-epimerase